MNDPDEEDQQREHEPDRKAHGVSLPPGVKAPPPATPRNLPETIRRIREIGLGRKLGRILRIMVFFFFFFFFFKKFTPDHVQNQRKPVFPEVGRKGLP